MSAPRPFFHLQHTAVKVVCQEEDEMKVETLSGFFDLKADVERLAGKIFECEEERALELEKKGFVRLLEAKTKKVASKKSK